MSNKSIAGLMIVGTFCLSILYTVAMYAPFYASRTIKNTNQKQPQTTLQVLEQEYQDCVEYYTASAYHCDSLKNQFNEAKTKQ